MWIKVMWILRILNKKNKNTKKRKKINNKFLKIISMLIINFREIMIINNNKIIHNNNNQQEHGLQSRIKILDNIETNKVINILNLEISIKQLKVIVKQ